MTQIVIVIPRPVKWPSIYQQSWYLTGASEVERSLCQTAVEISPLHFVPVEMTVFCHSERSREVSLPNNGRDLSAPLRSGRDDSFLSFRAKPRNLLAKQR